LSERVKSNIGDFLTPIQIISFLSDDVYSRSKVQREVSQRSEFCKALAKVFQSAICYGFAPLLMNQLFKKQIYREKSRDICSKEGSFSSSFIKLLISASAIVSELFK